MGSCNIEVCGALLYMCISDIAIAGAHGTIAMSLKQVEATTEKRAVALVQGGP